MEDPHQNCWLVDFVVDIHVCNNKSIMAKFQERPTKVRRSISDRVLPGREIVCLSLGVEDGLEGLILNLKNIYYLSYNLCNLVSLRLLNNNGIFYNNEHENLYQVISKKILA